MKQRDTRVNAKDIQKNPMQIKYERALDLKYNGN